MAIVRGKLYDKNGHARPAGWGVKLMYKVDGVWTCEAVLCVRDSEGNFNSSVAYGCQPPYQSITPRSYSPKIVYPCSQPTSPTYACWATSPMPWLVIDGTNTRDVIGQCSQVEGDGGVAIDVRTLYLFDYLTDDSRMVSPEALEQDIQAIEAAGYLVTYRTAVGGVLQVQSRTSAEPPVFERTGLLCYPYCLPNPMEEGRDA
jgi:hypothetical protein